MSNCCYGWGRQGDTENGETRRRHFAEDPLVSSCLSLSLFVRITNNIVGLALSAMTLRKPFWVLRRGARLTQGSPPDFGQPWAVR
jgi:hypothetical protein